jgi:tellurite resistance protein
MTMNAFLPVGPIAKAEHADALLELAFLVTAADGRLAAEEAAAFRDLMARVRGKGVSDDEVALLYQRFTNQLEGSTCAARVRAVAPKLPVQHREDAFRVGLALALIDRDASPHEDDLMEVLFQALELDAARAEALAAEVRAALSPPKEGGPVPSTR